MGYTFRAVRSVGYLMACVAFNLATMIINESKKKYSGTHLTRCWQPVSTRMQGVDMEE